MNVLSMFPIIRMSRKVRNMDSKRVTAAEVGKNFGQFADKALVEPVTITKYGREHLVLLSAVEYARLVSRDRRAYRAHEVPDDVLGALEKSEAPAESKAAQRELDKSSR